jgi:hypothetical protein
MFENDDESNSGSDADAKDQRSSGSESSEDTNSKRFEWDKKKIEALKQQSKVKIVNGKVQDEVPDYRISVIEDDFIEGEVIKISDDVYNLTIAANMSKTCSPQ